MDALTTVLDSLRVASSVVSRAALGAPWSIRTEGGETSIFHVVARGSCFVRADGAREAQPLERGDTVLFPRGSAHVLSSDPGRAPVPIRTLGSERPGVPFLRFGGSGAETSLLCGSFRFERDAARTLTPLLPQQLIVRGDAELADWFAHTLALLDRELERPEDGGDVVIARLMDVLFAQVMKKSLASGGDADGWFAAIRDPQVGRALGLIHERPGDEWSAESLAAAVGLSRTRFYERFTQLVGEPPARYVARFRVTAAADLMRRREISTAALAESVGYASEDAFVRAFKRYVGQTPSEFRKTGLPARDLAPAE